MMYSSAVEPSPIEVIPNIEQRWVSLKTNEANEVIEDLTYMMAVTRISPEDPSRPPEISHRMMHIVSMLRSGKKNHHTRKKIIAVIHKYLGAVRVFLMTAKLDGVALYQKLFESTMIAIVREVEDIESDR